MSKKQRTKGNVKPSSSARAAELFQGGELASTSLVTFDVLREDGDDIENADVRTALRQLWKRDVTTKLKALSSLEDFVGSSTVGEVKPMLSSWTRIYCKVSLDGDWRVRQGAHLVSSSLIEKIGKGIGSHLKTMLPYWLLGTCDGNHTVRRQVTTAFETSFKPDKRKAAFGLCRDELLSMSIDNVTSQPSSSKPSKEDDTEESPEARQERLACSSLRLLSKLIWNTDDCDLDLVVSSIRGQIIAVYKVFKGIVNSRNAQVKAAFFSVIAALGSPHMKLLDDSAGKVFNSAVNCLESQDSVLSREAWQSFLGFLGAYKKDCWTFSSCDKAVVPKLCAVARRSYSVNADLISPGLVVALASLPDSKQQLRLLTSLHDGMIAGLEAGKPCCDVVTAYFDATSLLLSLDHAPTDLVRKQLLQYVQSALKSNSSLLPYTGFVKRQLSTETHLLFMKDHLAEARPVALGMLSWQNCPPKVLKNVAVLITNIETDWSQETLDAVLEMLDKLTARSLLETIDFVMVVRPCRVVEDDALERIRGKCMDQLTGNGVVVEPLVRYLVQTMPGGGEDQLLREIKATNNASACSAAINQVINSDVASTKQFVSSLEFACFVRDVVVMALGQGQQLDVDCLLQWLGRTTDRLEDSKQQQITSDLFALLADKLSVSATDQESLVVVPCSIATALLRRLDDSTTVPLRDVLSKLGAALVKMYLATGTEEVRMALELCLRKIGPGFLSDLRKIVWETINVDGYAVVEDHLPALLDLTAAIYTAKDLLHFLPTPQDWLAAEKALCIPCMLLPTPVPEVILGAPSPAEPPVLAAETDFWNNVYVSKIIVIKLHNPIGQSIALDVDDTQRVRVYFHLLLAWAYANRMRSYGNLTMRKAEANFYELQYRELVNYLLFADIGPGLFWEDFLSLVEADGASAWLAMLDGLHSLEFRDDAKNVAGDVLKRMVEAQVPSCVEAGILSAMSPRLGLDQKDLDIDGLISGLTRDENETPVDPSILELLMTFATRGQRIQKARMMMVDNSIRLKVLHFILQQKDNLDDSLIFGRPISVETEDCLRFNVALVLLMTSVVDTIEELDSDLRDFIFCSVIAWFQSFEEGTKYPLRQHELLLLLSLCDLFQQLSAKVEDVGSDKLKEEWNEFFKRGISSLALYAFLRFLDECRAESFGYHHLAAAFSKCLADAEPSVILELKLKDALLSPELDALEYPSDLQSILMSLSTQLRSPVPSVQMTCYRLLLALTENIVEVQRKCFRYPSDLQSILMSLSTQLRSPVPSVQMTCYRLLLALTENIVEVQRKCFRYPSDLQSILMSLSTQLRSPVPSVQMTCYRLLLALTENIVEVQRKCFRYPSDLQSILMSLSTQLRSPVPSVQMTCYRLLLALTENIVEVQRKCFRYPSDLQSILMSLSTQLRSPVPSVHMTCYRLLLALTENIVEVQRKCFRYPSDLQSILMSLSTQLRSPVPSVQMTCYRLLLALTENIVEVQRKCFRYPSDLQSILMSLSTQLRSPVPSVQMTCYRLLLALTENIVEVQRKCFRYPSDLQSILMSLSTQLRSPVPSVQMTCYRLLLALTENIVEVQRKCFRYPSDLQSILMSLSTQLRSPVPSVQMTCYRLLLALTENIVEVQRKCFRYPSDLQSILMSLSTQLRSPVPSVQMTCYRLLLALTENIVEVQRKCFRYPSDLQSILMSLSTQLRSPVPSVQMTCYRLLLALTENIVEVQRKCFRYPSDLQSILMSLSTQLRSPVPSVQMTCYRLLLALTENIVEVQRKCFRYPSDLQSILMSLSTQLRSPVPSVQMTCYRLLLALTENIVEVQRKCFRYPSDLQSILMSLSTQLRSPVPSVQMTCYRLLLALTENIVEVQRKCFRYPSDLQSILMSLSTQLRSPVPSVQMTCYRLLLALTENIVEVQRKCFRYPSDLQSILMSLSTQLRSPVPSVQMTCYRLLLALTENIVEVQTKRLDSDSSTETGSVKSEMGMEQHIPPFYKSVITGTGEVLSKAMVAYDEHLMVLDPATRTYSAALSYLLTWKLLLAYIQALPSQHRGGVTDHLRDTKLLENLLMALLCLMPTGGCVDQGDYRGLPASDDFVYPDANTVELTASHVFFETLRTLPGMVRQWWNNQNRSLTALFEKRTEGFVSDLLCYDELAIVNEKKGNQENLKLTVRQSAKEVIAVYNMDDDLKMELVVKLPSNYPLGTISIDCTKRVGVAKEQWRKWMLQLSVFLMHQNGSVLEGLMQWKRNIDKHMDGVEDCMICMMTVHSTNYQLPKIACKQCKKKFHSACLYKWFNTSNTANCPLCRTEF